MTVTVKLLLASQGRIQKPIRLSPETIRAVLNRWLEEMESDSVQRLRAALNTFIVRVEVTNDAGTVYYTLPASAILPEKRAMDGCRGGDSNPYSLAGSRF